jgi:hypothetical protein
MVTIGLPQDVAAGETVALVLVPGDANDEMFQLRRSDGNTRGWAFSVLDDYLVVTQLGIFDDNNEGLLTAHEVGIWNRITQELLVSAIVPSGDEAQLVDRFRYVDVAPTRLDPGYYVIGAFYDALSGDQYLTSVDDVDAASGVVYGRDVLNRSAFGFPGENGTNAAKDTAGYFGPNFQFVPEPTSATLLLSAAIVFSILGSRCCRSFGRPCGIERRT